MAGTKKASQKVQAPKAQSPKAEAPKKDEAKVRGEPLAIIKAESKETLASIVKALNGTFKASEVKTGGTWFRLRLYAK